MRSTGRPNPILWSDLRRVVAAAVLFVASGCAATQPEPPDLARLYRQTAEAGIEARNPLVVVPGTLGSRLAHEPTGELVWGGRRFSVDPDTEEGLRLLALPIGDGATPLAELRDDVAPAGLLQKAQVSFLGAVIEEGVYDGIVQTLSAGGYRPILGARLARAFLGEQEGGRAPRPAEPTAPPLPDDSVVFDYDWRRDLVESAHRLYRELKRRQEAVSAARAAAGEIEIQPQKFDLIAHSMGGLAVRYFLMYGDAPLPLDGPLPPVTWKGAQLVEKAVIVGTPHAGSATAFENLVNGKSFSPLTPDFQAALLGTHPSVYQLLPRVRHARVVWRGDADRPRPVDDLYDVALWDRLHWGLLSDDAAEALAALLPAIADPEARRARARAHLDRLLRRAKRFHLAIDRSAPPPPNLDVFLVVGGGFETPAVASVDAATGAVEITSFEEGDGVVLRSSALFDERVGRAYTPGLVSPYRFRATLFLPDEHVRLTQSRVFGDNLLFWLLEEPRRASPDRLASPRLGGGRAPAAEAYDILDRAERGD